MTFLLLLTAVTLVNSALGAEVRITDINEFIKFKNNVNSGTNYSGTTVFLESDLSLAGMTFEPIGNGTNYFSCVFDGQGHVISNLSMTFSSQFVGLFGYSTGLTIKNVILGSSCSITSSYGSSAYIGGIIGNCYAIDGQCNIENSVNMGSVTFSGGIPFLYKSRLGGIAGSFSSSSGHDSTVKNCANYGDVTHSSGGSTLNIGGIVGYSEGSSTKRVYIYNCLNHGTIAYNGTTSINLYIGGITGNTTYTTIENCVSGGKISMIATAPSNNDIGSIVGWVNSGTSINCTYFTSDLSGYGKCGSGTSPSESNTLNYDSTSFELNGTASIGSYTGTSLIDALNAAANYYTLRDYSHWLLNKGNNAVSFTINKNPPFTLNTQVILLPSLANEGGMSFDGWYTDEGLTTPLAEFEATSETELYGSFCSSSNFTVTLDVNGGDELSVKEMTIGCDRVYGDLSTPTRTEATFLGWFTEKDCGDKIESGDKVTIHNDHTLYAHWSINSYTLTFILNNGDEPEVRVLEFNETITYPADPVRAGYSFNGWDKNITNMPASNTNTTAQWTANNYTVTFNPSEGSVSQSTKVVAFGSVYGDLPNATRTGYTFLGWFTEKDESITGESIVETPDDHTLYAHWLEVTPIQVEIVFSTKDMDKEEIERVIKKYTDADFKITMLESIADETRAIVDFFDAERATEFIRNVNAALERGEANKIKRVGFAQKGTDSFSPAYLQMSLLWLF